MSADLHAHRHFLNDYYRTVRHVYDVSRRFFLFGRDRALAGLLQAEWTNFVEIGPGTGRNLRALHARRPGARYGGVEASDEMLAHARKRCPWAALEQGFAETFDLRALLGAPPDRVLFSYSLSMVLDPREALLNARRALAPGGEIWIVDFAHGRRLWGPFRASLRRFLAAFRVAPVRAELLEELGARITFGPGDYYLIARIAA